MVYKLKQFIFILAFLGLVTGCGGGGGDPGGGGNPGGGNSGGGARNNSFDASSMSKKDFEAVSGVINADSFPITNIDGTLVSKRKFLTKRLAPGPDNGYGHAVIDFIDTMISSPCFEDPTFVKNQDGSFRLDVYRDYLKCIPLVSVLLLPITQEGIFINDLIVLDFKGVRVELSGKTLDYITGIGTIAQITYKYGYVAKSITAPDTEYREYRMIASLLNNNEPCQFNLSITSSATLTDCIIAMKEGDTRTESVEILEYKNIVVPTYNPDDLFDFDRFFTFGSIGFKFDRLEGTISYPAGTYIVTDGTTETKGQL